MSTGPQLRFYKDENLKGNQLEKLTEIYNLFREDNPKYISRQECLSLKSAENFIFVFSNFEGPAYEYLSSLKTRIISVQCMLVSLQTKKKLPRSPIPIFSFAMMDLNVCCTNIEKKLREEIYNKVTLMRGKTSKIFTESVTHLVTTEVGSAKYHAAAGMKIPVMLPDWIFNVWKDSEEEDVHATNSKYLQYSCPIFNKYIICASGFNETKKNEMKQLIESEGGTYSGDLVCGTTTHLITNEPKGAKYEHAKTWKINVVKSEWVYDSKQAKYCQPEKNYQVESSTHTSTPTDINRIQKAQHRAPEIDLSVISKPNQLNATKLVNETENQITRMNNMSSTMLNNSTNNISMSTTLNNQTSKKIDTANKAMTNYTDLPKELNLIGKIKLTLFDGIGIYSENFESTINQKINKICNSGGAIKFDEYNSDVTHVIVNQMNEVKCKSYIELNPEVNIVTIDWLIDSCKNNQLAECKSYCVHKNALNSVKTPKKRARPEKTTQPITELSKQTLQDSDLNGYLSQYLNAEAAAVKKTVIPKQFTPTTAKPKLSISRPSFSTDMEKSITSKSNNTTLGSKLEVKKPTNQGIFSNKNIQIIGFDNDETESMEDLLLDKGASIIPFDPNISEYSSKTKVDVDYTLMPVTIPKRILNNNPATVYWMRKSIEQNKLLELTDDIFYQPIPKYNTDKPLTDCIITVSGFNSHEKDNVTNLCKLLGAKIQNSLSLKKTPEVLANTHLICNKAVGPKYVAAKSWHLPITGVHWVIDCCVTGNKADEEKYTIENQTDHKELIKALTAIRQHESDTTMSYAGSDNFKMNNSSISTTIQNETTDGIRSSRTGGSFLEPQGVQEISGRHDQTETNNHNDSSLTCHNESKRQRLDKSKNASMNNDEQKNQDTEDDEDMNFNEDGEAIPKSIESCEKVQKSNMSVRNMNMTPKISTGFGTPVNPRLKELRRTDSHFSPIAAQNSSPVENNNMNDQSIEYEKQNKLVLSTPNWMKPDKSGENAFSFKPNFDYDKIIENFKTPDVVGNKKALSKNFEKVNNTPLDQLYANAIAAAHANSQIPNYYSNYGTSPALHLEYSFDKSYNQEGEKKVNGDYKKTTTDEEDDRIMPTPCEVQKMQQILKNVKIYVSRKLVKQQTEIFKIAECLGAEFLWTYNDTCSHFIYSGKLTDTNKELKVAKEQDKIIVSSDWIYSCKEKGHFVDENSFLITNNSSAKSAASRRASIAKNSETPKKKPDFKLEINSKPDAPIPVVTKQTVQDAYEEYNSKESENNELQNDTELTNDEQSVNDEESCNDIQQQEEITANHENETTDQVEQELEEAPEIIPDSMDIKINFLDQLQDKLASINKSKSNNSSKSKWARNASGNIHNTNNETTNDSTNDNQNDTSRKSMYEITKNGVVSETESQMLANYNFLDGNNMNSEETVLSEDQALRELNNSRSKWGLSSGGNDSNNMIRKKSRSMDKNDFDKTDLDMENSSENDNDLSNLKRKINSDKNKDMKSLKSSNKINKVSDENDDESPSIMKTKKCINMDPPASSQIQMTIWKEDNVSASVQHSIKGSKSRTVNSNKNLAKDAIADRIISASRASTSSKR